MDSEKHTGNSAGKKKEETKLYYLRVDNNITENVEANKGILQSKFTDNVTNKIKTETWKAIFYHNCC